MKRDIRNDPLYREVAEHFHRIYEPAIGRFHAAFDLAAAPDGQTLAFTGSIYERPSGTPITRIGLVNAKTMQGKLFSSGPNKDRMPRFSPRGKTFAFLSDRGEAGRFQLYLYDLEQSGSPSAAPVVDGIVENFAWSADGNRILLQTAGVGADLSGAAGSGTLATAEDALPGWIPDVEETVPSQMWRHLWLWRLGDSVAHRVTQDGVTIWEAQWFGDDDAIAIVSDNPREGAWYSARVERINLHSGERRVTYLPQEQLGVPCASPSGHLAAVIEACSSDRTLVAGDIVIINASGDGVRRYSPGNVDVTQIAWRDDSTLFYIGLRGFETVAGHLDARDGSFVEVWSTRESCGSWYPSAALLPERSFAVVLESYDHYQRIVEIGDGNSREIYDLDCGSSTYVRDVGGRLEPLTWNGRDGLEIQGYLAVPNATGPHPLVVLIHGGPVWAFRNMWSMSYIFTPLFVSRGYAVLHPNPRGSSGRGQEFARRVRGDMLGEDTYDIIRGVEELVSRGVVDPSRIAVTGRSYGGMMSSWLVTQTRLFAAAMPMAPVTDNVSQHFTSNIPEFDALFFGASPYDGTEMYTRRSPVLSARTASTPTLSIAGARDRCTPPSQALEFHRALVENGVPSELVIYPNEGHHIDHLEAQVDLCARMLDWLNRYALSARRTEMRAVAPIS